MKLSVNKSDNGIDKSSCGVHGLVERVLVIHAGNRGFDSQRGTCPNDFSDPVDQDIRTQCALSWKIVISEWRSVIAGSLNGSDGVCFIKPAKLYMCTQTHYKHDEEGRTARSVRSHGSVPLSLSGNVVTRIGLHTHKSYKWMQAFKWP